MREEGCCSFRPLKELCIYQSLGTEADDDFITIATFRFGGLNDPDCDKRSRFVYMILSPDKLNRVASTAGRNL